MHYRIHLHYIHLPLGLCQTPKSSQPEVVKTTLRASPRDFATQPNPRQRSSTRRSNTIQYPGTLPRHQILNRGRLMTFISACTTSPRPHPFAPATPLPYLLLDSRSLPGRYYPLNSLLNKYNTCVPRLDFYFFARVAQTRRITTGLCLARDFANQPNPRDPRSSIPAPRVSHTTLQGTLSHHTRSSRPEVVYTSAAS